MTRLRATNLCYQSFHPSHLPAIGASNSDTGSGLGASRGGSLGPPRALPPDIQREVGAIVWREGPLWLFRFSGAFPVLGRVSGSRARCVARVSWPTCRLRHGRSIGRAGVGLKEKSLLPLATTQNAREGGAVNTCGIRYLPPKILEPSLAIRLIFQDITNETDDAF